MIEIYDDGQCLQKYLRPGTNEQSRNCRVWIRPWDFPQLPWVSSDSAAFEEQPRMAHP